MDGGIENAARARAIALGMDVELQLEKTSKAGFQPVLYMLRHARERAIAAMTKMVLIDASDAVAIRALQLEVMLFDDMVDSCREAVTRGREIEQVVSDEERAEINDLIIQNWAVAENIGAKEVNDR